MPSTTIYNKLLSLVTRNLILAGSILFIVIVGCGLMAVRSLQASIERSTRASLMEKGTILIVNNSQALRGLAVDHAFSAIRELLSAAVKADLDVVYAIFMDNQRQPWALCQRDENDTAQAPVAPLDDSLSRWAARITQAGFTEIKQRGHSYIEFAAPVIVEGERLGTIRYGLSTQRTLDVVKSQTKALYKWAPLFGLGILAVIVVTLFIGSMRARKQAHAITRPIHDLVGAASTITGGNYAEPVQAKSDDEVGDLANAFETMRQTMQKYTENLETIVKERTAQLKEAQSELIDKAHKAGMADIASSALHNIGNILNSVKTSAESMDELVERSPVGELSKANDLLRDNIDSIEDFICRDPKGKKLMQYYLKLEQPLQEACNAIKENTARLLDKVNVIKDVITAQQNYAGIGGFTQEANLADIMDDAFTMQSVSIERHSITIERDYRFSRTMRVQKTKLVHILVNLVKNAKDAMLGIPNDKRRIVASIFQEGDGVFIRLSDNGTGIEKENITRIFSHGFTTKKEGHGFGLHSSANYLKEMGGEIWAESKGKGAGAVFVIRFPANLISSES